MPDPAEDGLEEPGLKLSSKRQNEIDDLVQKEDNKMVSNVNKCFIA